MNPSDANSALATLRQLKEMLDAGTLTPQEFEALKQQLVFGPGATTPSPEPPPSTLGYASSPPAPVADSPLIPAQVDLAPSSVKPEGTTWLAPTAPTLLENTPTDPLIEAPEQRRNPLTLVFSIGGALLLLAMVLYLTLGSNTPDEHLTSTSQTAADSARIAPEVGPQAEQLTLPPAAPETIRVTRPTAAPIATPAPASTKFRTDSAAASAPATTTPAVTPAKPTTKPAPTSTVAADTAI